MGCRVAQPLILLTKLYRGGEWLRACLESVRPFTDGAVCVLSERPWCDGAFPPENCSQPLGEFAHDHPDYPCKVLAGEWSRQEEQYDAGIRVVRELYGDARVLLADTDEIWDPRDLNSLIQFAAHHPHAAYLAPMHTYVKLPIYRVAPPEPCCPVALVDLARFPGLLGVRGNAIPDRILVRGVRMHHFSYVRKDFADIQLKFRTSAIGDGVPSHSDWFERVWDKIPDVRDFHTSIGFESCWQRLETVSLDALPDLARPVAQEILDGLGRAQTTDCGA